MEIRYAYWDGEKWNIEKVNSSEHWIDHPSMALDNDETPWIAYLSDQGITIKHWVEDGVWDTMILNPAEPPKTTYVEDLKIDIDDNGFPHICYFLHFQDIVDDEDYSGRYVSIAVDRN